MNPARIAEVLYIAGMFSANDLSPQVHWNIAIAKAVALKYVQQGYSVILPHTNLGWLEMERDRPSWEEMMHCCLTLIERSDRVVLCPLWQYSRGARIEKMHAERRGIEIEETSWISVFPLNTER